jgi:ACS family hexuronate transporter-like MFS transporter
LLFIATGLSFLDRQVLSMTIIRIQSEFGFSDVQYGFVNTAFLISYALMFTIGGRMIDRVGSKKGMAISVLIWSVANTLHGVMTNFYHLLAFRFLLGAGEGGCFPGAAKTVYTWFSEKKRALANGIAIGGSAIGAVIAPPLTTAIAGKYGWRWSFVIPGLIGLVWVIAWLSIRWNKEDRRPVVPPEDRPAKNNTFISILKSREAVLFMVIRFMLDPVIYFIMFWAPKYLNEQRHIPFERIGGLFWIPFLGLGISNMLGGWFSDRLIKKGMGVDRARKTVMGLAAVLTLAAPFIAKVSSVEIAVALMTLVLFAHGFWITNYITAISDTFGTWGTSTVVGLSGTAGAISGLVVNPLIGFVVQHYSYDPIWFIVGFMYPLAFLLFILFMPRIRSLYMTSQ